MERSNSCKEECGLPERKRRTQSKQNKESPRYECFCTKQYLSYPALYLHLKNKHVNYFNHSRGSRRLQNTKLIQTFDSSQGYKVFKLPADGSQDLEDDDGPENGPRTARVKAQSNIHFQVDNMVYPGFMPNYNPYFSFDLMAHSRHSLNKIIDPLLLPIEVAFTIFVDGLGPVSSKQRQETELLLALFVDCLNKHYDRLGDERIGDKQVKRYTAQYNAEYVFRIRGFFEEVYLKGLKEEQSEPFFFFLEHSYVMTSESYKSVLRRLKEYIFETQNDRLEQQNTHKSRSLVKNNEEDEDEYRPESDSDR